MKRDEFFNCDISKFVFNLKKENDLRKELGSQMNTFELFEFKNFEEQFKKNNRKILSKKTFFEYLKNIKNNTCFEKEKGILVKIEIYDLSKNNLFLLFSDIFEIHFLAKTDKKIRIFGTFKVLGKYKELELKNDKDKLELNLEIIFNNFYQNNI